MSLAGGGGIGYRPAMSDTLCITGGRVIDPDSGTDAVRDLFVRDGRFVTSLDGPADETVDAAGHIVLPGLVDPHVRFAEPGYEEDETIATGSAAAAAGGVTTVGCLPETRPVIDTQATVEFVALQAERSGLCRVHPIGAVTKGRGGEELAEIGQLVGGGARALSDGRDPIRNAEVMRRALQYAGMFKLALMHRPQVPELVDGGVMHDGRVSTRLGLTGMPSAAEEIMVRRDIALAELTGGRVHLIGLSSADSVDEVADAKKRGVRVTCDVTPYHLRFTEDELSAFDPAFKLDPPLRTEADRAALIRGVVSGTIDCVSSDHRPVAAEKKDVELSESPFGVVGLETLLAMCVDTLVTPGLMDWRELAERLCLAPAKLLNSKAGTLGEGAVADVAIVDPKAVWTVDAAAFRSKSRNTPLDGHLMPCRVVRTILGGKTVFAAT